MSKSFRNRRAPSSQLVGLLLLGAISGNAQAAHPFITDDTGTQGGGHWQLELNTDRTRVTDGGINTNNQSVNAALTYGASESLDVAFNLPYLQMDTNGQPTTKGVGDATVQAKWRFYENENGWSLALKPNTVQWSIASACSNGFLG